MKATALALAATLTAGPALADPPRVATDIPPVHSLVAQVMQGVGKPDLILPPGASPHGYAMRPSEAAMLAEADLIVWTGPILAPWLERAIDTLGANAASLELLETEGTLLLEFREGVAFEHEHGHEHGHGAEEDHAHGGHGDDGDEGDEGDEARASDAHHDHDAEAGRAERADQEAHAHDHAGADPHAWLDPQNARVWLGAIADALSEADPANAATYARNAAEGQAQLDALADELAKTLAPIRDRPFIVFHDAYHYFEHRFGIEAAGAISLSDASPPGPARISEIRDVLARTGAACVFAEPQFAPGLIETVTEGAPARAATLDPVGQSLEPGPDLYPRLLRDLAAGLRDCLAQG